MTPPNIPGRLAAVGLVLSFVAANAAWSDGHTDTDRITTVLRSYESLANQGDAQGIGALYAQDAILLPDRFDAFEGKDAITGFYTFAFSALTLNLQFDIDPDDIVVADDTAYATTSSTGTRFIKDTGQTVPEINRELWVFEKIDGAWKIARYAFNTPP